jgi:hypothetical protein
LRPVNRIIGWTVPAEISVEIAVGKRIEPL